MAKNCLLITLLFLLYSSWKYSQSKVIGIQKKFPKQIFDFFINFRGSYISFVENIQKLATVNLKWHPKCVSNKNSNICLRHVFNNPMNLVHVRQKKIDH